MKTKVSSKKNRKKPVLKQYIKKSKPKLTTNKPKLVLIYDNILAIEAQKGADSSFPDEKFRHDFRGKNAAVYGLPDGSLIIKGKKRLWKNFTY